MIRCFKISGKDTYHATTLWGEDIPMNSKRLGLVQQSSARLMRESFSLKRFLISSLASSAYRSNLKCITRGVGGLSLGKPLRSNSMKAGVANCVNGQLHATIARIKSSSNCNWLSCTKNVWISGPFVLAAELTEGALCLNRQALRCRLRLAVEVLDDVDARGWGYSRPQC